MLSCLKRRQGTIAHHGGGAQFTSLEEDGARIDAEREKVLRELDCFVLDNSLRESTVAQLVGHTLEDKLKIIEAVQRVGYTDVILGALASMPRVDDKLCEDICTSQRTGDEQFENIRFYAFTELADLCPSSSGPEVSWAEIMKAFPSALSRMKDHGLRNVILESNNPPLRICVEQWRDLIADRVRWIRENLDADARIFFNFRDLCPVMDATPDRVLNMIPYLAEMRIFGLLFEEPTGDVLESELRRWCLQVKRAMLECKSETSRGPDGSYWGESAQLLVHIHEKFGLANRMVLACLESGATGIWCSLCEEGAGNGHACSANTLMNLAHLGNKKVLKRYNCPALRHAAATVTRSSVFQPPPERTPIYGGRALDVVFSESGMGATRVHHDDFDLASFFCESAPVRISTLASPEMVAERLSQLWRHAEQAKCNREGAPEQATTHQKQVWDLKICKTMLQLMEEDLLAGRHEEYMSVHGLTHLYLRAGGELLPVMVDYINANNDAMQGSVSLDHHASQTERLLAEVRAVWDHWWRPHGPTGAEVFQRLSPSGGEGGTEIEKGADALTHEIFYNAFLALYCPCFKCEDTQRLFRVLDLDHDSKIEWEEFKVFLLWANREYRPETAQELLQTTFTKGILPLVNEQRKETLRERSTQKKAQKNRF